MENKKIVIMNEEYEIEECEIGKLEIKEEMIEEKKDKVKVKKNGNR